MPERTDIEVSLPCLEAVLAGTLALMTGYSQALQADQSPATRVRMGSKIGKNLELLLDHPGLTEAFRRVVAGLRMRWVEMSACTEQSVPITGASSFAHPAACEPAALPDGCFAVAAPTRVQ